jgi:PTH1 family peptidyl-tRNA hydrolase
MKAIIGLGNPGKEYENTRHNVGFMIVDRLREQWNFSDFSLNKKFDAEISEGLRGGKKILLAKPQTFMNLSGTSVRKILDFYKLSPDDIVVIQDELDLPIGTHKVATDSSSAGHNGIKDIIKHLGTQRFKRLRVGIATPQQDASCLRGAHDFVLGSFSREEEETLRDLLPSLIGEIERLATLR